MISLLDISHIFYIPDILTVLPNKMILISKCFRVSSIFEKVFLKVKYLNIFRTYTPAFKAITLESFDTISKLASRHLYTVLTRGTLVTHLTSANNDLYNILPSIPISSQPDGVNLSIIIEYLQKLINPPPSKNRLK